MSHKQIVFFKLSFVFFITACININVFAKGGLLDANGNPLSLETLELLTSASKKVSNRSQNKKFKKGSKSLKKSNAGHSSPALERELFEVLKAGDAQRARYLLQKGVKPVYLDEYGTSPLRLATARGWASMVVELIKHGADVHEKGRKGITLLHTAASRGYIDVAKVLVKEGISPSVKTKTKWTPLHIAARYGHWQVVQFLLQQGVNPNSKNNQRQTALDLAIQLKHQGVVKILSRVTSVTPLKNRRQALNLLSKTKRKKHKKRKKRHAKS